MFFFMDAQVDLGTKLLEVLYIVIGLICLFAGFKNARDKENPCRYGTAFFWAVLGIVIAFGRWIPNQVNGALVIAMCVPAVCQRVKIGKVDVPTEEESGENYRKVGMKIFIPALAIGVCALFFALFTKLGALVGVGVGVGVSAILLCLFVRSNSPKVLLYDSERMLSTVGPVSMLPMLLACLGTVFTAAGVGDAIASLVGNIIPAGNVDLGIVVYAIGMMLFTMIMGNAFAAITVMTVGIGAPFVLAFGADPVLTGMIGLTCGYCGTLLTPMAANFNIVPVAMLDMKGKFTVIRNQALIAFAMLAFQIIYMILFK